MNQDSGKKYYVRFFAATAFIVTLLIAYIYPNVMIIDALGVKLSHVISFAYILLLSGLCLKRIIGLECAANYVTLFIAYLFLLSYFPADLMLSPTTTTGGDMGSHYVIADYLTNYLVPHGKLIGWYPHWLAGTPMLEFYFIPPYLLMTLMALFMPLQIAFKLGTVVGIFLLPLASFLAVRFLGFRFPAPAIAGSFALPFLFIESYSQFGGNIKSTLAGQFPHGISFALAFLSLALIYYGMRKGKHMAMNAVLLALVILTHIYTSILVAAVIALFIIENLARILVASLALSQKEAEEIVKRRLDHIRYVISVGILAVLIAGFWLIPLFAKFAYSMAPKDVFYGFPDINQALEPDFMIFYVFAIFCMIGFLVMGLFRLMSALKNKRELGRFIDEDNGLLVLCYYMLAAVFFFLFSNRTNILYVRFIPFLFFVPLMFAAVGIGGMTQRLKAVALIPIIVVLFTAYWVNTGLPEIDSPYVSHGVKDIPNWIKWNYEGLENKGDPRTHDKWQSYKKLNDYLKTLDSSGRVDIEYYDYNAFGTPRVFEASPIFSDKDVMESLLLESSVTFPFFYYLQKEVSNDAWWPGFPLKMPKLNLDRGQEDLRLYNVKYFVVYSDTVKNAIHSNPRYTLLSKIDDFEVYSVNADSQFIEPAKKEPVLVVTDDWKKYAFPWISMNYTDVPLVFTSSVGEYELSHFRIVILDKKVPVTGGPNTQVFDADQWGEAMKASKPLDACTVTMTSFVEESMSAQTDCIGKPVLVKVSYFPNWMSAAGERIYMATPSVMLLYPENKDLNLIYGATWSDTLGNAMTILGLLIAAYLALITVGPFRKKVHEPVKSAYESSSLFAQRKSSLNGGGAGIVSFLKLVYRNKLKLLVILLVIVGAYYAYMYLTKNNECSSYCVSRGYSSGQDHLSDTVVDQFSMGFRHQSENQAHNFVCNALCDSSRPDQVYIPSGYVEWDMKVEANTPNTLGLKLLDGTNCRSGDLYINGELFTKMTGDGSRGWDNFEFKIPAEKLPSDKIHLRLQFDDIGCFGWDIAGAYTKVPSCRCYK